MEHTRGSIFASNRLARARAARWHGTRRLATRLLVLLIGLALAGLAPALAQHVGDPEAGEALFARNCAGCHQANGMGVPGAFPPLVGTVPVFLHAGPDGRAILTSIVLFGLQGPITAGGERFDGTMPSWAGTLDDVAIADVLAYITSAWGNEAALPPDFEPFTSDEVATLRERAWSPQRVHEAWLELGF